MENNLSTAPASEWEDVGYFDDYHKLRHNPCGTEVAILMGHCPTCPKCQPEAWKALASVVE